MAVGADPLVQRVISDSEGALSADQPSHHTAIARMQP